jgi:hypothetical protein
MYVREREKTNKGSNNIMSHWRKWMISGGGGGEYLARSQGGQGEGEGGGRSADMADTVGAAAGRTQPAWAPVSSPTGTW